MFTKYKSVIAVIVMSFAFIGVFGLSIAPHAYAKATVPDYCPGSPNYNGTDTLSANQQKVCSSIPAGCPGGPDLSSGQKAPKPSSCPFAAPTSSSSGSGAGGGITSNSCGGYSVNPSSQCPVSNISDPATKCDQNTCDIVKKYVNPAVNLLAALVGIIVVIGVIAGGIQYSTSGSDPQKAMKAKARVTNAIVALIAFTFLYGFLQWLLPGGLLH